MADEDLQNEQTPGYVPPKKVSLDTMKNLDADDEALNRWKAQLLAGADAAATDDPRKVIVKSMTMKPADRDPIVLDLTGDLSTLKDTAIVIKEGSQYHIEIGFKIQHEVVSGLKYLQAVYRKGIRVSKDSFMLGSYGPKSEDQTARTRVEEAPSGMLVRGHYTVKSKFVDDDNETHLAWEWSFDIKKQWS